MVCPKCKQHVANGEPECICGYNFEVGAMRSTSLPSNEVYKKDPTPKEFYQKIGLIFDRLGNTYWVLYFVGACTLVLGLLYALVWPENNVFGSAYLSIGVGVFFIVSGILVQNALPFAFAALILCFVLYCIDTILYLVMLFTSHYMKLSGLYLHIVFIVVLVNGIRAFIAMRKLKKSQASAAQQTV